MADGSVVMTVQVQGPADSDAQEIDEQAQSLRSELLAAGVDDARPATAGDAPVGTKAGEALELGALAVSLAPAALQGAISTVRDWTSHRPVRKVTISIGEDSLTLEGATQRQQEQLLEAFLDRHGPRRD